jgi:hypothetical protein
MRCLTICLFRMVIRPYRSDPIVRHIRVLAMRDAATVGADLRAARRDGSEIRPYPMIDNSCSTSCYSKVIGASQPFAAEPQILSSDLFFAAILSAYR